MKFARNQCTLCGKAKHLTEFKGKQVCGHCLDFIKSSF